MFPLLVPSLLLTTFLFLYLLLLLLLYQERIYLGCPRQGATYSNPPTSEQPHNSNKTTCNPPSCVPITKDNFAKTRDEGDRANYNYGIIPSRQDPAFVNN